MKRKKVGLALGSGGTRGFAHIGVVKKLLEAGIKIDYLAGSSSGAIVASYYAVHQEIQGFEEIMMKMGKVEFASFVDITAPRKALIRGRKMHNFLDDLLNKSLFKNTKVPLIINATDLRKAKEVYLKRGKIADAIMASVAIPGIFPPIQWERKLLVDGGVLNPTPVDIVEKMGADVVIGVDLTMKGVNLSLQNPGIFEVLTRSFDILRSETAKMSTRKVRKNLVIIKPKIDPNLGFVGCFRQKEKVVEAGEKVTEQILPKLEKLLS